MAAAGLAAGAAVTGNDVLAWTSRAQASTEATALTNGRTKAIRGMANLPTSGFDVPDIDIQ